MTATTAPPVLEIGDVARALGVTVETVRRWQKQGRIAAPQRTSSGRRIFSPDDLEVMREARAARHSGPRPLDAA